MTDPNDFPYVCPNCGPHKRFLTLVGLWSHLENKHPQRPKPTPLEAESFNGLYDHVQDNELPTRDLSPRSYDNKSPTRFDHVSPTRTTADRDKSPNARSNARTYLAAPAEHGSIYNDHIKELERQLEEAKVDELRNQINHRSQEDLHRPTENNINGIDDGYVKPPYNNIQASTRSLEFVPPPSPQRVRPRPEPLSYRDQKFKDSIERMKDYDDLTSTVERLREELRYKESKLDRANRELEVIALDRRKLQRETLDLSKENNASAEYVGLLHKQMADKNALMEEKEREVMQLTELLKGTSQKETMARHQLEDFINTLIHRAERAESELAALKGQQPNTTVVPVNNLQQQQNSPYMSNKYDLDMMDVESPMINPTRVSSLQSSRDIHDGPIAHAHPFSSADSGVGESIPSSAKTVDSHRGFPSNQVTSPPPGGKKNGIWPSPDEALRQQERELQEKLKDVKDKQRKLKKQRAPLPPVIVEPPIDYSTDSITSVTDDTDPEDPNYRMPLTHKKRRSTKKKVQPVNKPIKKGSSLLSPNDAAKRKNDALFCVFMYLDTVTLGKISEVSKDWRDLSRHPSLWRNVRLGKSRISSKYLSTISKWCTEVRSLTLMGLKSRSKKPNENSESYFRNITGSLEPGLEDILKVSAKTMTTLKIVDCRNLFTERSLWIASCYTRKLTQLVYVSDTYPASPEVIWSLGSGCKEIKALIIPPIQPNERPKAFNDQCCYLIGQYWHHLQILCIGGAGVTDAGLLHIAEHCLRLQILELDHLFELKEATAAQMCALGLKGLEVLDFTFTPVTPKALVQFVSACRKLKSISVHIGISDYFRDKENSKNKAEYSQIVTNLRTLLTHPMFADLLTLETDYG